MGVQGLTSYVEGKRELFQDVRFRESRLVIDGCSLFFRLYFNHGLDQQHGGDYDAFSGLLAQFLTALAACRIKPYVVLDGGMDASDKKFPTLRQRLQSKIKEADSLSHGRHGSVLPLLTRHVFIQVLSQQGVPLVQCPAEADWEIACLANEWGCPVLTNDSDFFIFDLPGGYLPFRFFQWTNVNGKGPDRFISARCYTVTGLCRRFGGMNRELLPLCAVLAGNDYATPKGTNTLLALLDLTGPGGNGERRKTSPSLIEGLLLWLSSFRGAGEALVEVGRLMGGGGGGGGGRGRARGGGKGGGERGVRDGLSSLLWAGMQEYHLTPRSSLARWFSEGLEAPPAGQTEGSKTTPGWFNQAAWRGVLAPMLLDVLVVRRVLLIPQVENSRLPSSHCTAQPIRQALYGILLQGGRPGGDNQGEEMERDGHGGSIKKSPEQGKDLRAQGGNFGPGMRGKDGRGRGARGNGVVQGGLGKEQEQGRQGQENPVRGQGAAGKGSALAPGCVEEYDRLELSLRRSNAEPHPPRTQLHFDTLDKAPPPLRLGVLCDILRVNQCALTGVPPHLRLAVAVTSFWMREATPSPSLPQLHALLLGIVHGELARTNQPGVQQTEWAAERGVWVGLDRQRVRPGERRGMDVGVAHCFSQWQACLWSTLCLNQLLSLPLPEPCMAWLFSGSLVHGLVRCLEGGRPAESFLGGAPLSWQLYCSLLAALGSCNTGTFPSSSLSERGRKGGSRRGRGRRGRGRGRQAAGGRGTPTQETVNRFALLMSKEEELDEEEQY